MDIATLIGVVGGLGLVIFAILLKASLLNFIDPASILIVFGGTTAATLISFSMASVLRTFKIMLTIFFSHQVNNIETLKEMINVSALARKDGQLALERYQTENRFLKKGLGLAADGTEGPVLRRVLEVERDAIIDRHNESQLILEKMGELAPAWGMIGTLIGLVIMLLSLEDPSTYRSSHGRRFVNHLLRRILGQLFTHARSHKT